MKKDQGQGTWTQDLNQLVKKPRFSNTRCMEIRYKSTTLPGVGSDNNQEREMKERLIIQKKDDIHSQTQVFYNQGIPNTV